MSKNTSVEFSGTKKREKGGQHAATQTAEKHDSAKALGTKNGQSYEISKCLTASSDSTLEDSSKVTGTKRREIGPAEAVRRANNHARDSRTVQGTCKPSEITTD